MIELEQIQAETRRPEIRRRIGDLVPRLDRIAEASGNRWQAKAARASKCAGLFYARRWHECRVELGGILKDMTAFRSESSAGFIQYLTVQEKAPEFLEAEIRFMLLMIEAMEGNFQKALEVAQQLKGRFPQWSSRHRLDGTIELLERGQCPFRIP